MNSRGAGEFAGDEPAWLHGHPHEPNLVIPGGDGSFRLVHGEVEHLIALLALSTLPRTVIEECYIVSTGHGVSGPFCFGGVLLGDLLARVAPEFKYTHVDVVGVDGFGARLTHAEIAGAPAHRPPLLALTLDDQPLTRATGLVRLIVPTEAGDALKQVKWVARVVLHQGEDASV